MKENDYQVADYRVLIWPDTHRGHNAVVRQLKDGQSSALDTGLSVGGLQQPYFALIPLQSRDQRPRALG